MARTLLTGYPELVPSGSPPDDYQRIQSSPGAFGGIVGQAEEKAGAQVHQLGGELFKIYDETASTDAYTKYQTAVNSLLYGDPRDPSKKGYLELAGEEAMQARPQVLSRMEDLIGQIKGGLKTGPSQVDFERASRRLQSYSLSQVGRHYDQEGKRWSVSTMDSALASDERAIANTYNDDEYFKHKIEDMRGNAGKKAHLNGTDEKGAIAEADSRAVEARLNGALARRDFSAAKQIFDQYGNLLDDKKRPTYQSHIHSGATSAEGDALANGALGLAPMPAPSGARTITPQQGDVGQKVAATFRARGWTDAAITGALNNGITESSLKAWNNPGAGGEQGVFQFHPGSHLPAFQQSYKGDTSPEAQANYVADVVEREMPGYAQSADHRSATSRFFKEFERPKDQSDERLAERGGNTPKSQSILAGLGGDSPTTILANIKAQPEDSWQGKTGVLPQAQPIPTTAGGAPPRPTGEAPANRSGLPPLTDIWDRVWNTPGYSDEARSKAWTKAKERYTAFEADAARSERIQAQQQNQAMQAREADIWKDVYSPQPKITAQQIANDPAFAGHNERRSQMIALINNPPGSGLPAAQSYNMALSLLDRIRRPEGDPQKITDVGPLYDAAIGGKLNKGDFDFVKKEFDQIRTPGGEVFAKRRTDLIKQIQPFITKSNPLLGKLDPEGDGQLYNFEWALDQKIDQYRKEGKNPQDLLDPTKPDFVGKPEFLTQFQTAMQQSAKAAAGSINKTPVFPQPGQGQNPPPIPGPLPKAPPAAAPSAGPVATAPIPPLQPRLPGESPADYLKRINPAAAPEPAPPVR